MRSDAVKATPAAVSRGSAQDARVAQDLQGVDEVVGVLADEGHPLARQGVGEAELACVQPLAHESGAS